MARVGLQRRTMRLTARVPATCSRRLGWRRSRLAHLRMPSDFSTAADLEFLCANAVAEGLRLEFKEKEDRTTAALSKGDKKQIAEAVSSFANSDGGTIIFGIKTKRSGDGDVAAELMPIANVEQFASNFRMVCSLNVESRPYPTLRYRRSP